jgi:hypothetical protein
MIDQSIFLLDIFQRQHGCSLFVCLCSIGRASIFTFFIIYIISLLLRFAISIHTTSFVLLLLLLLAQSLHYIPPLISPYNSEELDICIYEEHFVFKWRAGGSGGWKGGIVGEIFVLLFCFFFLDPP